MDKKTLRRLLVGEFSFWRLVRSILFFYVTVGIWAYFCSDALLFQPQGATYRDDRQIIKLIKSDRPTISALHLPNPKAQYTILYSHGNAEDIGDIRPNLQAIRAIGFSVFTYDYRGYGTSEGQPTVKGAYEDIDAAYAYLTQTLLVPPSRIIIYGRSVGGGPSVDLARREPVAGLILESTFVSAFRVVTHVPLYPFDKFPNLNKIKQVNCPVLIIHGTDDEVIPFWHGQELFTVAEQPKRFFRIEGARHNDVLWVAGEQYAEILHEFGSLISAIAPDNQSLIKYDSRY